MDQDADALRIVEQTNAGKRRIPTIFFPDGAVLIEPTDAELAAKSGRRNPIAPFTTSSLSAERPPD